ncbi:MAG: hypothetical protein KME31_27220 [Tolypothrix carrinoi HA7290-LM1]|nr:hypothetical protein [Tolypothrix carrinoi HA7290-LM1]
MGNGHWAMGNGHWAMGIKEVQESECVNKYDSFHAPCPMTAGASTEGTSATHCLPNAQCPMPHSPFPTPSNHIAQRIF